MTHPSVGTRSRAELGGTNYAPLPWIHCPTATSGASTIATNLGGDVNSSHVHSKSGMRAYYSLASSEMTIHC